MRKIIYFPLWKIDEMEYFLGQMELSGWRLSKVEYSLIFDFVKSSKKNSDYVVTYNMSRDFVPTMYEYEQELLSVYLANKIPANKTLFNVFRVTSDDRNFDCIKKYRNAYVKHVLFQYLLISLIFLFVSSFVFVASLMCKNTIAIISCLSFVCFFLSLLGVIYMAYGFIKQKLKCMD